MPSPWGKEPEVPSSMLMKNRRKVKKKKKQQQRQIQLGCILLTTGTRYINTAAVQAVRHRQRFVSNVWKMRGAQGDSFFCTDLNTCTAWVVPLPCVTTDSSLHSSCVMAFDLTAASGTDVLTDLASSFAMLNAYLVRPRVCR